VLPITSSNRHGSLDIPDDGPLLQGGFGTGTECNNNCPGSVSTQVRTFLPSCHSHLSAFQTYTNARIVLDKADASFSGTLGVGSGVVASALTTSDSGKTWTVASIKIPPMKVGMQAEHFRRDPNDLLSID